MKALSQLLKMRNFLTVEKYWKEKHASYVNKATENDNATYALASQGEDLVWVKGLLRNQSPKTLIATM